MRVDPLLRFRRDLVQALIQFANKTQGGAWSLVQCQEVPGVTRLEFESDYPLRCGSPEPGDPLGIRRFQIIVTPVVERIQEDQRG